ncbi:hypothetical protein P5V15_003320 [Pogonomyrmex californicus]
MDIIESNKYAGACDNYINDIITYFEWAIHLNRLMLNYIGIWPSMHKNTYDKFLSNLRAMFTFIVLLFIGIIPAIHSLMRTWGDMMLIIDNLQYTLPMITAILKLVIVWWRKRGRIHNHAQNARILTMIGYGFMILSIALVIILPLFGKSVRYLTNITDPIKILPLQTYYIYDKDKSPYFEFTFVAQIFLILMCFASYSGVDTLFGLLVFHLCGQMENLKEKLINMEQFKNYNKGLAFIVKDHIRLIKCFDVIENTFTLLLLGLLIYFGTLFCLYGFLILAILTEGKKMSLMRFLYLISVAMNVCCHMCLFCAVGEILIAQCESIYRATYEHKWYKLKPKEMKNLLLIMIRTNKPLYITAGKIFPMTMSMFCNLIKTSAGYISVLLTMQS